MSTIIDGTIHFTSLDRVAIKGLTAKKRRDERFIKGTIKGDRMVLVYRSCSREKVPGTKRKFRTVTYDRFVYCERVFSPSHQDFWWEGKSVHQHSY